MSDVRESDSRNMGGSIAARNGDLNYIQAQVGLRNAGTGVANRDLLAVNLEVWMLLNTMIAFAGENRDLEAGDGNQI